MSRRSAVGLVAALALAGCGGGAKSNGGYATGGPVKGKPGGTLTVLSRGDVDSIDPGATYYPFTFMLAYATQRPLYSYEPGDGAHAVPDLAIQLPHVSPDR